MLIAERQSRLKDLIAQRGIIDLETLASELGVSQSTVRRDVDALESQGQVKRTYGGVMWVADQKGAARPYAFDQRMGFQLDAKRQIAKAAASLVEPDETIIIDGGTTTFYLAQELLGRPLQLVTNSLPIADLFQNDENVELILTGGLMYPRYGVLLGPTAESVLAAINTRTMFFSVAGVHAGHLYNQNLLLVSAERKMMEGAQRIVLLVDSGKFGQQALAKLCPLSDVDIVVCDSQLSEDAQRQVRDAGCQLIIT